MRSICATIVMVRTEEPDNSTRPSVAKLIAACFALSAFSIAVLAGIFGGNEALLVLTRAFLAAVVCYPVGLVAGIMFDCVIREQLIAEAAATVEAEVAHEPGGGVAQGESTEQQAGAPPV